MALSSNNNVSKMKLGRISQHTILLLRLINKILGVKFKIEEIEKDDYDEEINEEDEIEEDYNDEGDIDEQPDRVDIPK
jgi:hypothetical protein